MEISKTRNKKKFPQTKTMPARIHSVNSPFPSKRAEFLHYHKISIEVLLDKIKYCQFQILSHPLKSKYEYYKKILIELKENLESILNEEKLKAELLNKKISEIKRPLQNELYIENKNGQEKTAYNKNIQSLKSEVKLLKMLNFKVENYIKYINNMILIKKDENNYLNLCMEYPFVEEKIIMCIQQKYLTLINRILQHQMSNSLEKFKLIVSLKQYQNNEIEDINKNITKIRNLISIKKNGYIDKNKIIQEESKEFSNNISIVYNFNNTFGLNKEKRQDEENEKKYYNTIKINDEGNNIDVGIIDPHDIIPSYRYETIKDINSNDNKNNIQQLINLNMYIKLNVNYNKLKYNDDIIFNSYRDTKTYNNYHNKTKQISKYYYCNSLPY